MTRTYVPLARNYDPREWHRELQRTARAKMPTAHEQAALDLYRRVLREALDNASKGGGDEASAPRAVRIGVAHGSGDTNAGPPGRNLAATKEAV